MKPAMKMTCSGMRGGDFFRGGDPSPPSAPPLFLREMKKIFQPITIQSNMAKRIEDYKRSVRSAMKTASIYSKAAEPQITALASALKSLDLANQDIEGLTTTVVMSSQGAKAHPAFKIRKEAEDSITKQMKALGLTSLAFQEKGEDPLIELTKKLLEVKRECENDDDPFLRKEYDIEDDEDEEGDMGEESGDI